MLHNTVHLYRINHGDQNRFPLERYRISLISNIFAVSITVHDLQCTSPKTGYLLNAIHSSKKTQLDSGEGGTSLPL